MTYITTQAKVLTVFEDKITQSIKLAEMIDMMFWAWKIFDYISFEDDEYY